MRRHGPDPSLDLLPHTAANNGCHNRRQSPASEYTLPTTILSTVNLHPIPKGQLPKSSQGKKRTMLVPTLFIQQDGVLTFHPFLIKSFFLFGGLLLLGVHTFLFWEMRYAPVQQPPLEGNSIDSTPQLSLTPLGPRDREQYTIRINTYQRHEQLGVSIDHHASCPGVALIQVVWCEEGDPPDHLLQLHPNKVIFERHEVNTLNERYHILPSSTTPTLGILSIDDDVLRPCEAIDSGFFQWTKSPSRMVGFDYRVHVINDDGSWKYGYLSTTQRGNQYSMSLPRYAFLHRDYLDWYMKQLPRPIFDHVAESFNCEDIAMSFMISSLTDGRPPLLANFWAIETMVKLYVPKKISGTKNHKALRDACVESFAHQLNLKGRLYAALILHRNDTMFYCGDAHYNKDDADLPIDINQNQDPSRRQMEHNKQVNQWRKQGSNGIRQIIAAMKREVSVKAKLAGLLEHNDERKQNMK